MYPVNEKDGVTIVGIGKELDARSAEKCREFFLDLVSGGKRRIVADLSALDFIDSSGLGSLVTAVKTARHAGGDLRLCGLTGPVKSIFQLTRLLKVFRTFESVESAVSSFLPA